MCTTVSPFTLGSWPPHEPCFVARVLRDGHACCECKDRSFPALLGWQATVHPVFDGEGCAGRKYRDDPTIFGWDLINEPRCNCFPSKLPPPSEWDTLEGACSPKCADKITVRPSLLNCANALCSSPAALVGPEQEPDP